MSTTVYFATNRVATGPLDNPQSYGPNIQPPSDSSDMIYGVASVDGIDIGSNTQGRITGIMNINRGSFADGAITDLSNPGRNLLVFIHGFDNDFDDAITRAAFNREWLAAFAPDGATDTTVIALSWPSLGKILSFPILPADYLHDQNMARASGLHTMTFLANLEPILNEARKSGSRGFLLVHSMGALALQSGVENWFLHGNGPAPMFERAMLAAGDCGADTFGQPFPGRLSGLSQLASHISLYYSHADAVLQLSQAVNLGAQRLGQDGPLHRTDPSLFPPNVYTMIDATAFHDYEFNLLTSHQYYRMSKACRAVMAQDMAGQPVIA